MKEFRAAIIFACALLATPVHATILGSGGASCGTWIADRQRNEALSQLNQAWVLGFVSGYSTYKPTQLGLPKPMDSRSMMLWIDNFCDANPGKDIADAAKALIEEMTGRASR